jgi:hypothetical protein
MLAAAGARAAGRGPVGGHADPGPGAGIAFSLGRTSLQDLSYAGRWDGLTVLRRPVDTNFHSGHGWNVRDGTSEVRCLGG